MPVPCLRARAGRRCHWQLLEGASTIPLTLFEAAAELDAGPIYAQEMLQLQGHELAPEWQRLQARPRFGSAVNG